MTGGACVTRLNAVRAGKFAEKMRVVAQGHVIMVNGAGNPASLRADRLCNSWFLHGGAGDERQIVRRCVMQIVVQAVTIHKVRMGAAEFLCLCVHAFRERRFRSRNVFRRRNAGVVRASQ